MLKDIYTYILYTDFQVDVIFMEITLDYEIQEFMSLNSYSYLLNQLISQLFTYLSPWLSAASLLDKKNWLG